MSKPESQKKPSAAVSQRTAHPYSANDPIPVPEATELDTDTAWGLFDELADPKTKPTPASEPFDETVPADLAPMDEKTKPAPPKGRLANPRDPAEGL